MRFATQLSVGLLLLLNQGCVDSTILAYESVALPLDGVSELHVSTYPSGFSRPTYSIPLLYKALRSPESVYLQVFVRPVGRKAGKNPHIERIRIHRFGYRFPSDDLTVLLQGYDQNFWMQGSTQYNEQVSDPVGHAEHWYVYLTIDLTMNGTRYRFEDVRSNATSRHSIRPLLLYALR